jgi:hypothetical protein
MSGDTTVDLRAPTVTGVYRISSTRGDTGVRVRVIRASLIIGFDSAVIAAVHEASTVQSVFAPPTGDDSMKVDIRLSTDSISGSHRVTSAYFPRLPVVDALPVSTNPAAKFPTGQVDSLARAEVVFRLVVDRDGLADLGAVEVVRAGDFPFVRAALEALPLQRFRPATVKGCPIAQVIDYPFTFAPASSEPPGRH